jgi:hypothetical protein
MYDEDASIPNDDRADALVDQLMPDGFEWRRLTRSYPRTAMTIAFAGGLVIGRTHGGGLLAALTGFVISEVSRNVQGMVEDLTH